MSSFNNSTEIINTWIAAANAGDVDGMLALYSPNALLLPTFSPHTLRDSESRRAYFERLASRKGFSAMLHVKTLKVQLVAPGIEVVSGIYRFGLEIDDEPLVFEARFSITVNLDSQGPILHHHSSQLPRTLS